MGRDESVGRGLRCGELDAKYAVGGLADRTVVAGVRAVELAQLAIDGRSQVVDALDGGCGKGERGGSCGGAWASRQGAVVVAADLDAAPAADEGSVAADELSGAVGTPRKVAHGVGAADGDACARGDGDLVALAIESDAGEIA